MKQIFPEEVLESTVETHQFKHGKKSKIIYTIILTALILVFALLPIIRVDIYTSSRGLIKPDKERLAITSLNSGKVIYTNLKNNRFVEKGDTLLILDDKVVDEQINLSKQQITDFNLFIDDLSYLINNSHPASYKIKSPKFKKEFLLYSQKLQELQTRFKKLKKDYNRNKVLFEKGIISRVEFEEVTFNYDLVKNSINQLKQQQLNTWQATLTEYNNTLLEIKSKTKQLLENKSQFVIKAPTTGTLIGVKPIEKGSYINAGEALTSISPNTNLVVECFISPQDIGLLKLNNPVNFQIDAYNYNQWGLATGKVIEVGKDIEIIDNTPAFKILCQLNEKELSLKNGFKGQLKKGMTLNAQFKLAERSLFNLLYDRVDDWFNPSQKDFTSINN
ncbi:secretion protein HlyD [Seonamhaeicola sp. S2-3]|uniref:HlyD family secretion protein n=1 Tax=Seonamhaeicola sp. S2-3 TaxID=1936081 RepID=UPI000972992D|nr:HlyD family efflux transporter periplasmic adaptor subunit [Seonamhaeicola sp. S2-3]APY11037.1 secretion protein HlyD [Seonamhaeicola sp. S2-3]